MQWCSRAGRRRIQGFRAGPTPVGCRHPAAGRTTLTEDQTSLTAASPAPLVSIITPTYNHALYIGRCLESVLAQTEPRWEQIVIDDGSTDGTAEIVNQFTDARIRYVAQRHRGIAGLGDAYNLALRMARGEYVAILEGDDFWPQDKLERQLPEFEDPEVVLSWGLAAETDPAGETRRLTLNSASSAGTSTRLRPRPSSCCSRGTAFPRARCCAERALCWQSVAFTSLRASQMSTIRRGSSCAESGGSHRSTGSWGSTVATITRSP